MNNEEHSIDFGAAKVQKDEIQARAKFLASQETPITLAVKSLISDNGIRVDDPKYSQTLQNLLEKFINRECILNDVPWKIFVEGAYRPQNKSSKILYHSHYLPQLYRHYAIAQGLPLQTTWDIKYKVITDASIQKEYREIAKVQNKIMSMSELDEKCRNIWDAFQSNTPKIKVITLPKSSVIGQADGREGMFYALSGCYDIVGAVGHMNFMDHKGNIETFYFDYNIDTVKTKLYISKFGDVKYTSYGQYPQQITATKWCRTCVETYYRPKLVGVKIDTEEEEEYARENAARENRLNALEEKAKAFD